MEDRELKLTSGFAALALVLLCLGVLIFAVTGAVLANWPAMMWLIIPGFLAWIISLFGFIVNGPNQARVVQLFGKYVGTVKDVGFYYGNPFYWRLRVSLRVRTFETGMSDKHLAELQAAIEQIEVEVSRIRFPLTFTDQLYNFRSHIDIVRRKIAANAIALSDGTIDAESGQSGGPLDLRVEFRKERQKVDWLS